MKQKGSEIPNSRYDTWICGSCGNTNTTYRCAQCGKEREFPDDRVRITNTKTKDEYTWIEIFVMILFVAGMVWVLLVLFP